MCKISNNRFNFWNTIKANQKKCFMALAIFNGILYFTVVKSGEDNVKRVLNISETNEKYLFWFLGVGAVLSYIMFFYKTLESLNLYPNNFYEKGLLVFVPFAASSYFNAGVEGSESFGFSFPLSVTIGTILFLLRLINCTDGAIKFPNRLIEMQGFWQKARIERHYAEMIRLITISLISLLYSISLTDSIYNAFSIILDWFSLQPSSTFSHVFSTIASMMGAVGMIPLILYWTHRGLRQLTNGGQNVEVSVNTSVTLDPTDIYTFLSLPAAVPVVLGVLGSATGTSPLMFGKLGAFAEYSRIASSIAFAVLSTIPGMSTLFRKICCCQRTPNDIADETHKPLLAN